MSQPPPHWRIDVNAIDCSAVIGVYASERAAPQRLELSLSLWLEGEISDRLSDTVCYQQAAAQVKQLVEASRFELLEALVDAVACHLLAARGVRRVRVKVRKFCELAGGAYPEVTIERNHRA